MNSFHSMRAVPAAASRRTGAFSLVVTLIIVSMLAVVAIGFLASMSSERTTADAFGNKTRAEQAAQAGADSAMAILREAFKDFPDSATVWETQSVNKDGSATVDATHRVAVNNEGTSLYVRALPKSSGNTNLPDPDADNRPGHLLKVGESDPKTTNADGSDARKLFVLPLASGAQYRPVDAVYNWTNPDAKDKLDASYINTEQLTDPSVLTNRSAKEIGAVDLNVLRYKGDTQGWLGSPPPANGSARVAPRTTRVPWVEVRQADAADSASAPIVARYAFWVEDESFRTNVNYAGLGNNPTSVTRDRLDNAASAQPPASYPTATQDLPVNAGTLDLFGSLRTVFGSGASSSQTVADFSKTIFDARSKYPAGLFPEALGFAHPPALSSGSEPALSAALTDQLRFLTTTTSSGLNLSRHGTQRLNLNELEYPKANTTNPAATAPDAQNIIDTIVKTIQFHAPNFGQRFYRNVTDAKSTSALAGVINSLSVQSTPDTNHTLIYLYKIATNIHDYMDADTKPTFVDGVKDPATGTYKGVIHHGLYEAPSIPGVPIYPQPGTNGGNIIWAQGKDSAPFIDECAVRFAGGPDATKKNYELDVDYYIEVWNPTTRDVAASSLGKHPRVRIIDPPPWQAATNYVVGASGARYANFLDPTPSPSSDSPARDYDIDISNVVFPAGKATVITTDKNYASHSAATGDTLNNFRYCPLLTGTNVYKGAMPPGGPYSYLILSGRLNGDHKASDYQTEVVMYSDDGYIDCAPGCMPIYSGSGTNMVYLPKTNPPNLFYGGSLRGNGGNNPYSATAEPSMTGDPRGNNEQLRTDPSYTGSTAIDPRYYNFSTVTAANPYPGTLGLPNTDYTKPDNNTGIFTAWPDFYQFPSTATLNASDASKAAAQAPVFIANSPLTSIGQLGDVYDPARYTGTGVLSARGGGRSLRIGQPEDLWDGNAVSASRSWASWRLTDFFCINDAMLQPGLININGVARDNGAALRAALTGFKFQADAPAGRGAPTIEKIALGVDPGIPGVDTIVSQMQARLTPASADPKYAPYNTGQGPFFERGEFSELPVFGRTIVAQTFPPTTQPSGDLVPGVNMSTQVFDRGREEIFRRLAEMITTRGNVYTVYAMGQALSPTGKATSTQRIQVTFRLTPKALGGSTTSTVASKDFHPALTLDPATNTLQPAPFDPLTRFNKPDHYDIEILSASKGGG